MNWQTLTSFLLATLLLAACAPTGPVKFYPGPDKPKNDIALVRVPGPITVTRIDDREVRVPSQEQGFYELHLSPGRHTLTFKYELYWGSEVSGMLIKSRPTGIQAEFSAGRVYELRYAEPGNENEAFSLASDFQAALIDTGSGTRIAATPSDELPAGLTNAEPLVRDMPATTSAQPGGALPTADQAANEDAVKRLKFWWLMADETEREAFRQWMQQDMPSFNE